jgi:hypothetical protein
LAVYLCPTDPATDREFVETGTPPTERFAMANYVANFGSPDLDGTPDRSDGVSSRNSATRVEEVVDGLSNTFFIGERVNGVRLLDQAQTPRSVAPVAHRGGSYHHSGTGGHMHFETIWAGAVRDHDDPTDDHGHMVLFHTAHTPNSPLTDDRDITAPHSGVAQFVFGDGSVHAIGVTIDNRVYAALGTRAGGEPVER